MLEKTGIKSEEEKINQLGGSKGLSLSKKFVTYFISKLSHVLDGLFLFSITIIQGDFYG